METWEAEDLNISSRSAIDAEETNEMIFGKPSKACVSVYVPPVNRYYMLLRLKWFS